MSNALFVKNRTEELGYDVWENFVVPPFYDRLGIGSSRKPKVIIGGRGCGKTMLLRYLSHESTFSEKREVVPDEALTHIGLYWRADTQFASMMQQRDIPVDTWCGAFRHLASISLGIEILRCLSNIARSSFESVTVDSVSSISFKRLSSFLAELPHSQVELQEYLERQLDEFEMWTNDVRSVQQPRFLPGTAFLKRMIELVGAQIQALKGAIFYVYIDEYENLAVYQQEIVNTWLKHSEPPLIFNLAMKRNGFKTRSTEGNESLSDIHDFRDIDLEDYDLEREFPVFAAEILFLQMSLAGLPTGPITPETLRDPSRLTNRRTESYTAAILQSVRTLLPSMTQKELAQGALDDESIARRLQNRIAKSLKRHDTKLEPQSFISPDFAEASVIVPALLARDTISPSALLNELQQLQEGRDNRFTGPTDWIHNNFIGCYLQLYDGLPRPCPFYGGFLTFCYMARGNLRHLLELCYESLARNKQSDLSPVDVDGQANAARHVATDLLAEIKSFGPKGNNLHSFVLRLGTLFSLSQQRPSQSEAERTHFSINGGEGELTQDEREFLSEAVKWSVVFEEKGTKKKSTIEPEDLEYVLNPVYSPYFHISYRKKKRIELSAQDASTLISGTYPEVRRLLRSFQTDWAVDLTEAPLPLFAHLESSKDE